MSAVEELQRSFEMLCGSEREQACRFIINALSVPVRRYIIPLPDGRTPYLERFILSEEDPSNKTYLHLIYESDGDRDPHDHPFDFSSTIVWGSYSQQCYARYCAKCDKSSWKDDASCAYCNGILVAKVAEAERQYLPGEVNSLKAHHLHRLTVIKGPVVTLVRRGPKVREWGFQTDQGWEHHESYIERKFPGARSTEVD